MRVIFYLLLLCLTILLGYFVFRVQVRRDYERRGKLSSVSIILEFLVFGVHANLPYAFLSVSWPALPPLTENTVLLNVGMSMIGVGFVCTVMSMSGLGFRKTLGQKQNTLCRSGFYRYTRNPQIVAYGVLILGCVVVWPSVYAFGWLLVYGVIAQMMVLTEEEHLSKVFGREYERYCQEVPRYFPM